MKSWDFLKLIASFSATATTLIPLQHDDHSALTLYWPDQATSYESKTKILPCFGCNRYSKEFRTRADRWHISPSSQIANCMISSAKKPRLSSLQGKPRAFYLQRLFTPACQQPVSAGSAEAPCSTSLAKCTALIALLNSRPLTAINTQLFAIHSSWTLSDLTYTERRDQCQVSFRLAIHGPKRSQLGKQRPYRSWSQWWVGLPPLAPFAGTTALNGRADNISPWGKMSLIGFWCFIWCLNHVLCIQVI